MSVARTVAKNTLVLLTAQIISSVLGFVYVIYAARYLGVQGYGLINFGLAFLGILGVVADLGSSYVITREVARDKSLAGKYVGNIVFVKLTLIVAILAVVFVLVHLSSYPAETANVLYVLTLSTCFSYFTTTFYAIFQAFEKMEFQSIGIILISVINVLGALYVVRLDLGVVAWASILVVSNAISLVYSVIVLLARFPRPKIEVDPRFLKRTVSLAFPFALSSILSTIAFRVDMVLLGVIQGNTAVGWYSAAYALLQFLLFIPSIIASSIYPRLSVLFVTSHEQLTFAFKLTLKLLLLVSIPISVGSTLLASNVIGIIYGAQFGESTIALQILIWTVPLIFTTYFFGTTLASINRQDLAVKILLCCTLFNIALNLIFIPRFSYIGAATVTVLTEILGFALEFYVLSKLIAPAPLYRYAVKPIIASVVMGAFIFTFITSALFVVIPIAIVLFGAMIVLLRYFSKEEFELFRQIIRPSSP
ncbi:MAG: flippase [Halobacteriota archaeon]